jgi:hypothetical protein
MIQLFSITGTSLEQRERPSSVAVSSLSLLSIPGEDTDDDAFGFFLIAVGMT